MKQWIKQLLCGHVYKTTHKESTSNFYHVFNNFSGSFMYNCEEVIHHDVCVKCGKVRIVKKERIIL